MIRGLKYLILVLVLQPSYGSDNRVCDMTNTNPMITVKENLNAGTQVYEVKFVGNAQQIETSAETHPYLRYDSSNGKVFTKVMMNAESDEKIPNFVLKCKDLSISATMSYRLLVSVANVNEFAPKFDKAKYEVTITEAVGPGRIIISDIKATDDDKETKAITYKIVPDAQYSQYFDMTQPTKGEVTVKKDLKFDQTITINLKVEANDNGDPNKTSTCDLVVKVVDLDDEPPVFTKTSYTGTIQATASVNTPVTVPTPIKAADGDKGLNVAVEYTVEALPGIKSYFKVDKTTGVVRLESLGIKEDETHTVLIKASQTDAPAKRFAVAPLVVTVQGQASTQLQLTFSKAEYVAQIPENHPSGGDVITVLASRSDSKPTITYEIAKASEHPQFKIDSSSGKISLADTATIDFEKTPKYTFNVEASAAGKKATAKVVVNLININDNSPQFVSSRYNFRVSKPEKGLKIGTVKASDQDGEPCKYSVRSYSDVFAISQQGELSISVEKKDLKQGSYVFVVACTDTGTPPREGTALVDMIIGNGSLPVVSAGPSGKMDLIPLLVLAGICALLLLIIIILVIYIQRRNAQLKREKAHKQNISNLSIFGDSTTNLNDDGATTVQENPLALENPGYFYMMKSDDSAPTNDYLSSEVRYPDSTYPMNGSTFTGSQNGSLPNRGKRVKIQDKEDPPANGHPADPKITVYF